MTVSIHHGVPGSYKTSGAVQDDLPDCVSAGRLLVTNIRGLNDAEHIIKILLKFKAIKKIDKEWKYETFEIMNLDTSIEENREKLRDFINWAEPDTFFIIDEINTIFPTTWRDVDLKRYDYRGDYSEDKKPKNLTEALEMHRHYNWDFVLTTPSYLKVHSMFRDVAEVAYKHKNRKTIGLGGSYWEIVHAADSNGKSRADVISTSVKRIKTYTFKLYQSTATGEVRDTRAGVNIFKTKKAALVVIAFICFVTYSYYELSTSTIFNETEPEAKQPRVVVSKGNNQNELPPQLNHANNNKGAVLQGTAFIQANSEEKEPIEDKIYFTGYLVNTYSFTSGQQDQAYSYSMLDLSRLGYTFKPISNKMGFLKYKKNKAKLVTSRPRSISNETHVIESKPIIDNPFQGTGS